jgi:hypothetical protein
MPTNEHEASSPSPPCDYFGHRWIPVEFTMGRKTFNAGNLFIEWGETNVINAHRIRVTKLYCPNCDSFINVPSDASDK